LEDTIAIYIGITLGVVCALAIAGRTLFWFRAQSRSDTPLLDLMIDQQSRHSARGRSKETASLRNISSFRQQRKAAPQLAMLERHLRNAILDENARERLVNDAMRTNSGTRAAAIRKVLSDLGDEDNRWS
jgi:hypothetical protein